MRERPVSVMIFGILNIGFALLGLLGVLVSMIFRSRIIGAGNPMMQQLYNNSTYAAWMKISTPLGVVVSLLLLAAGIGLLLLKNWARIASIGYGIYGIVGAIVGGFVMIKAFTSLAPANAGNTPEILVMAPLIGAVFGMLFGLIYPILLIVFMTRPKVVAAFAPAQIVP